MHKTLSPQEVLEKSQSYQQEMPFSERMPYRTVFEALTERKRIHPKLLASSFQLDAAVRYKADSLDWQTMHKKTTQAANLFRQLGIKENDVVAMLMPSCNETVITVMAGMTAGIINPINPLLSAEQISDILNDTKAKVLVTLKSFPKADIAQKAGNAVNNCPHIKHVVEIDLKKHVQKPLSWLIDFLRPKHEADHHANIIDFDRAIEAQNGDTLDFTEQQDDRVCAYFHTGGTTGTPKIAQHKQSGGIYNGWTNHELMFTHEDTVICPLPLFHVFAVYAVWFGCVVSGAHMILPTPAGARGKNVIKNFWQLIERWQSTIIVTVPTMISMLLQRPVNADISALKIAFSGSAPLPTELFNRFEEMTGAIVMEGYGMTEATCIISGNPNDGVRKIGSVGVPFPYTDVKIFKKTTDDTWCECETNEIGEVCAYNPGVYIGNTYTDPNKNKTLFVNDKYLRTGDLGRLDEDGYLWITGREKDLIIRGGHNIDPACIEEAILNHPDVAFVGAIGQPDIKSGEVPCAYVELTESAYKANSLNSQALTDFLQGAIQERAAQPKYIEIIASLPKTAVGKVFKPDLRKLAIRRVFNNTLNEANINCEVTEVFEDKQHGLTAVVSAKTNTEAKELVASALATLKAFNIPSIASDARKLIP